MKYYKIWAYIETVDESKDLYEDEEIPLGIGEFKSKKKAIEFAEKLHKQRSVL